MSKKIIFTNGLIDLAQPRLGSKVIFKTDDFFASAKRIIEPTAPVFKDGLFEAIEILAKHDENYIPKEVMETLKDQGLYKPSN